MNIRDEKMVVFMVVVMFDSCSTLLSYPVDILELCSVLHSYLWDGRVILMGQLSLMPMRIISGTAFMVFEVFSTCVCVSFHVLLCSFWWLFSYLFFGLVFGDVA